MITSGIGYLSFVVFIATFFYLIEKKSRHKIFDYLPSIVLVYILSMVSANSNIWTKNSEIEEIYKLTKNNLLPAMLFLILLQVNLKEFFALGKKSLIAFFASILSISLSLIFVVWLFNFNHSEAMTFSALSGSWLGGVANMVAVATALNVSEEMLGYALIVDAINYTIWVLFLLSVVKLSSKFNSWSGSTNFLQNSQIHNPIHAKNDTPKHYFQLILLALIASFISQFFSSRVAFLNEGTALVIIATFLGLLGSLTPLSKIEGSEKIASSMLFLLVALIGSGASLNYNGNIAYYVFAGTLILFIHASLMVAVAKIFKIDLFSISVASIACVGGVASASILASAYSRSLIGVAILMAVMGYLVGTFGGIAIGTVLMWIAG